MVTGCGHTPPPTHEVIEIAGETFNLELAYDDAARAQGLSGVEELPADGGMLFVFANQELQSFWMKDCVIDIDIIFLDSKGRITALHQMKAVAPQRPDEDDFMYEARVRAAASYSSVFPAQFAIELQAGTLDRLELEVEDKIALDAERLTALIAR